MSCGTNNKCGVYHADVAAAAEDVAGEVRVSMAPSKPQRSSSVKEQRFQIPRLPKKLNQTVQVDSANQMVLNIFSIIKKSENKLNLMNSRSLQVSNDDNDGYHCSLSSSPECDSTVQLELEGVNRNAERATAKSAIGEIVKHQATLSKSHLPYCGSETESEHYASYGGFYAGDEVSVLLLHVRAKLHRIVTRYYFAKISH